MEVYSSLATGRQESLDMDRLLKKGLQETISATC
jgi:hypothetical protein